MRVLICLILLGILIAPEVRAEDLKPAAWLNHPRVADRSEPYIFEYTPEGRPNLLAVVVQGTSLGMLGTVFLRKKEGCTSDTSATQLSPVARLDHPRISADFQGYLFEYKSKCAPLQTVLIAYTLQDFELDIQVVPR